MAVAVVAVAVVAGKKYFRQRSKGYQCYEINEELLDNQTMNILQRFILSSGSLPLLIGELSSIGTRQAEQKKELEGLLNRYREG